MEDNHEVKNPIVGDRAPERPKLNLKPRSQSREQLEGNIEVKRFRHSFPFLHPPFNYVAIHLFDYLISPKILPVIIAIKFTVLRCIEFGSFSNCKRENNVLVHKYTDDDVPLETNCEASLFKSLTLLYTLIILSVIFILVCHISIILQDREYKRTRCSNLKLFLFLFTSAID